MNIIETILTVNSLTLITLLTFALSIASTLVIDLLLPIPDKAEEHHNLYWARLEHFQTNKTSPLAVHNAKPIPNQA